VVVQDVLAPVTGGILPGSQPTALADPGAGVGGSLGPVLPPIIEQVIAPVGEIVDGVVGAVGPLVDQLVAPVIQVAGPLLDGVVTPVVQIVDPVLDAVVNPLVQALDPVLDAAIAPVLQVAAPVLDAIVTPVAQAAGVVNVVDTVTGGSTLATLLGTDAGGGQPIAVGSILFPDAPVTAAGNPNELFSAGGYTDLGLSLHSETPAGSGQVSVPGPAGSSTLLDQVFGGTADTQADQNDAAPGVTMPSALQEIALQGLGDGIHL
jgi:hypothetical protein